MTIELTGIEISRILSLYHLVNYFVIISTIIPLSKLHALASAVSICTSSAFPSPARTKTLFIIKARSPFVWIETISPSFKPYVSAVSGYKWICRAAIITPSVISTSPLGPTNFPPADSLISPEFRIGGFRPTFLASVKAR